MKAVDTYRALAGGGLAVLGLALWNDGYGQWALLPLVPGVIGLLVNWSLAPAWVLIVLAGGLAAFSPYRTLRGLNVPFPRTEDMVIAGAVLVYVAAALRLHSLAKGALPPDARREGRPAAARARGRGVLPAGPTRRTPEKVAPGEMVWLVVLAAVFAAAGYLVAFRIQTEHTPDGVHLPDQRIWRALISVWAMTAALAVGHALVSAVGWMAGGRDEARVYLQDQLWAATRGEQRRIQRWAERERLRKEEG